MKQINIILIILLAIFAGCVSRTLRQSAVRLKAINDLKRIQFAFNAYSENFGSPPDRLDRFSSGEIISPKLLAGYSYLSSPRISVVYTKKTFPAVIKGEPWGGPGEVADKDIPKGRGVLVVGSDPEIMPEKRFSDMYLSRDYKTGQPKLSVRIQCDQKDIKQGDEILITFEIKNIGKEKYEYTDRNYDRSGRMFEYKLTASDQLGVAIPDPREKGIPGAGGGLCSGNSIGPGESFKKTIPLNRWALIKNPGKYVVSGTYIVEESDPLRYFSSPSNSIVIEVKPRSKEEMSKYINGLRIQLENTNEYKEQSTLIQKLMYTFDKRTVPILIKEWYKPETAHFWIAEAFIFYIPMDRDIRKLLLETGKERGLAADMIWIFRHHNFEPEEVKQVILTSLKLNHKRKFKRWIFASQYYGDDRFTPHLVKFVLNPENKYKSQAIYALAYHRTDEAVATLKKLLKDPEHKRFTEAAIRAVYRESGKYGTPLRKDDFDVKYQKDK